MSPFSELAFLWRTLPFLWAHLRGRWYPLRYARLDDLMRIADMETDDDRNGVASFVVAARAELRLRADRIATLNRVPADQLTVAHVEQLGELLKPRRPQA